MVIGRMSIEKPIPELAMKVHEVFLDCLFRGAELVKGQTPGQFVFHPDRLERHRPEVEAFLRHVRQGDPGLEHHTSEELVLLCIGLGIVRPAVFP